MEFFFEEKVMDIFTSVFNPFLQLLENYLYPRSRIKSGGMIIASDMNKLRRPEEANRTLNRIPRLSGHPQYWTP